jgi:hypothetical protein
MSRVLKERHTCVGRGAVDQHHREASTQDICRQSPIANQADDMTGTVWFLSLKAAKRPNEICIRVQRNKVPLQHVAQLMEYRRRPVSAPQLQHGTACGADHTKERREMTPEGAAFSVHRRVDLVKDAGGFSSHPNPARRSADRSSASETPRCSASARLPSAPLNDTASPWSASIRRETRHDPRRPPAVDVAHHRVAFRGPATSPRRFQLAPAVHPVCGRLTLRALLPTPISH